jgi:hypothetical protein
LAGVVERRPGTRRPGPFADPQNDIEALFFTQSSIDKYAIPYVTRVYGVDYAAERRREWIKEKEEEEE